MKTARYESRSSRRWDLPHPPARILIIRFHAIGDVAITLPSIAAIRRAYSSARIDLMTTDPSSELAGAVELFDRIIRVTIPGSTARRCAMAMSSGISLRAASYDMVIDLQRNWISRMIRFLVNPSAWSEFDRFSPASAQDRTIATFREAGLDIREPQYQLPVKHDVLDEAARLLRTHGWDGRASLVCLNPAGIWPSRQWPTENYVALADMWPHSGSVRFLLVGTTRMRERTDRISSTLRGRVIDLIGGTSLREAFGILQHVDVMVSEDSGLMHAAWVSGVPTVALFGSSRHDWSAPGGDHSRCLHSGDLDCGACMEPECRFGDTHCLTRRTPEAVLREINVLLAGTGRGVEP